jgi:hypothetical protein
MNDLFAMLFGETCDEAINRQVARNRQAEPA